MTFSPAPVTALIAKSMRAWPHAGRCQPTAGCGRPADGATWPRILDEARHTADPVHLVRVFGITESTAIYYVHAAHPGRQSVIPRQ